MATTADQETILTTDFDALTIPLELKNRIQAMGGTDYNLIMQKKLSKADTLSNNKTARFLIPGCDIRAEFLTDEETKQLDGWDKGIPVTVIGPSSQSSRPLFLKRKKLGNLEGESFELVNSWAEVLRRNRDVLQKGVFVQVWSFRCRSKLFFALVKVGGKEASFDLLKPLQPSCQSTEFVFRKAGFLAYEFLTKGKLPNDDGVSELKPYQTFSSLPALDLPVQTFYSYNNCRPQLRPSGVYAPLVPLPFQARPIWIPTGAFAPSATLPLMPSYILPPAILAGHSLKSSIPITTGGTHLSKKRKK